LLFDHGTAFMPVKMDAFAISQTMPTSYGAYLKQLLNDNSDVLSVASIEQAAIQLRNAIESASFPDEQHRQAALARVQQIIDNPERFLQTLRDAQFATGPLDFGW
jgi:hypothetical protein